MCGSIGEWGGGEGGAGKGDGGVISGFPSLSLAAQNSRRHPPTHTEPGGPRAVAVHENPCVSSFGVTRGKHCPPPSHTRGEAHASLSVGIVAGSS